jgi:hypothetical protein
MEEILSQRTENTKTYNNGKSLVKQISMGALHYKDDYTDNKESWKDIDLTIVNGKVTKAPYTLTIDGNKATILCKRTGRTSTIETVSIGSSTISSSLNIASKTEIEKYVDFGLVVENERIRFQRTIKSADASTSATFKVSGDLPIKYQATDADGFPVEIQTSLEKGILTELVTKEGLKYPIKIDPTVDIKVGASTDDCFTLYRTSWQDLFLTDGYNFVGKYLSDWSKAGCGMRFLGVNIPSGATINSSHITFTAYNTSQTNGTVNSYIIGELSTSPATFSNLADYQARRGTSVGGANNNKRTSTKVAWDDIPKWSYPNTYDSPEIKTVVQEICDLGAVTDMVLWWDDHDGRTTGSTSLSIVRWAQSYDFSSTNCPQLYIDYTPAATSGHPAMKRFGGVPFCNTRNNIW